MTVWLALMRGGSPGEPAVERLVSGVISEGSKSGLEAHRVASPVIRHNRIEPAGYRHDARLSNESSKATTSIVSTVAGRPDFPRRRTGADHRLAR
jgi:hypothetical protein